MANDLERAVSFHKEIVEGFIFKDIQAAIDRKANFLAALGLVCYTEFLGGLTKGNFNRSRSNFEAFFDRLGQGYEAFRQNHDAASPKKGRLYHVYRCGLVHQYFIKAVSQPATVFMYDTASALISEPSTAYSTEARVPSVAAIVGTPIGVGIKHNGGYYFVVETYFRDFKEAAEQLLGQLKTDQNALGRCVNALNSVV